MRFLAISAAIVGALTTTVTAFPHKIRASNPNGQNVVYWGQDQNVKPLSNYCTSSAGIDIIVLSFLYQFGNGQTIPSGTIGNQCYISSNGVPQNCETLASDIEICKSNGIKVILSLGGASGAYSLSSQAEAEAIGQNLWKAYGDTAGDSSVPRPFGNTFVNGWDMDVETWVGNQYYQYLLASLRSNFASDPSNTYYITGAPQCPIPEPNMQVIITNAKFDYLWVQFYNNPECSITGKINFDDWVSNVANTPSAGAKIFLGVPASPLASTGTTSGSRYYIDPSSLATLVNQYKSSPSFGGVMMWSAGYSDSNVNNGCTYAQEAKSILTKGTIC
ncbi:Endochitinase 2 [Penicillium oxalicum]|uniref:Putative chitinase n=1 Tax=Penicillium oxalicum (strain 114-2 / CGMCC 5302) TaxID=933388 RepID=S8AWH6_PENO1|nr:Endochitinase 2 [Penicillium oxalicum]EPS26232.1 putative chitinase [Penicillium oxalicum 114-2]KAI2791819.1 Endochitinase 2 [Penicillium oxalicum]